MFAVAVRDGPGRPGPERGRQVEPAGRLAHRAHEPVPPPRRRRVAERPRHGRGDRAGWARATRGTSNGPPAWRPTGTCIRCFAPRRLAKTVLFLPHPDLEVSGTVYLGDRKIEVSGARGGQAHLWGSKHASRWAWVHCNDFTADRGTAPVGSFVDGVSVFVPRFGRELGPNTPFVGRVDGTDLHSTGPLAVTRNPSEFDLGGWRFEARSRDVRVKGDVSARPEDLVGVTYHDPDGELAYCYNTEVADMRLEVFRRVSRRMDAGGRAACGRSRTLRVCAAGAARGRRAEDPLKAVVTDGLPAWAPHSNGAGPGSWSGSSRRWVPRPPPSAPGSGASSEGSYRSLNLGILTDDVRDRVVANRQALARALGRDAASIVMGRQVHGASRADPRGACRGGARAGLAARGGCPGHGGAGAHAARARGRLRAARARLTGRRRGGPLRLARSRGRRRRASPRGAARPSARGGSRGARAGHRRLLLRGRGRGPGGVSRPRPRR